jgi:hypothetical protein
MREGPIQGVPASVAGDEDIGVLPVESGRYAAANQAFLGGDLGFWRPPPPVYSPPLAQDEPNVVESPPKTSDGPYKYTISPDYLIAPVAGQTITTPVDDWGSTTIQVIESPVAAHSFHTKPEVLRDYLAQFN